MVTACKIIFALNKMKAKAILAGTAVISISIVAFAYYRRYVKKKERRELENLEKFLDNRKTKTKPPTVKPSFEQIKEQEMKRQADLLLLRDKLVKRMEERSKEEERKRREQEID